MNKDKSQINLAIEDMNKAIPLIPLTDKEKEASVIDHKKLEQDQAVEAITEEIDKPLEEALIEPFSRKHTTGKKLIDERMRSILLRLAEKYFFYKAISARAGIYERRLTEELSCNKQFASAFAYARHKFIAHHQELLIQYAQDKKLKDWRAEQYILTIADKEYSERKYLTDAVSNQDAKILMLIKAEQLTIAGSEAKKILKGIETVGNTPLQHEKMSLMPFNPKKIGEATKKKKKTAKKV